MRALELIRRRLREERGMTLIELLSAVLIGGIVMTGAIRLIDASVRGSNTVLDRVEGLQKGRAAMEQLTQRLRAQACPDRATPAIQAATDTSVSFFSELGDETFTPEARRLTYASGSITEQRWNTLSNPYTNTFGTTPSATRIVVTEVAPQPSTPVFRYYTFEGTNPARPELLLQTPLSATDRARVVKITVAFDSRPTRKASTRNRIDTSLESDVYVRTADPTDPEHSPSCE